jgi:translation elongation factor EF-1beta
MATLYQKNYIMPTATPVSKTELVNHIKNAEHSGYALTLQEHTKDIEQWLKNLPE